ncbi:MAG: ywqD [Frankiales bacterium]|nr:ywqD [Frankiales bacterium]
MASGDGARILQRHTLVVLACIAAGAITALVVSSQTSRTYQSEAQVFVSAGHTANAGGALDRARFAQERIKSYIPLVTNPAVMTAVAKDLKLRTAPDRLAEQITASSPPDTVLLRIIARDGSAKTAQSLANATATQFSRYAVALEGTDAGAPAVELRITKLADQSGSPVSPRPLYNLALGLLIGAAAGLAVASLRQRWSPLPRTREGFEETSWAPPTFVSAPEPRRAVRPHR